MNQGRPRSKRERERARQDRQKQKMQRRDEARVRRAQSPEHPPGFDPDIAGIVPGPQANPWGEDLSDLYADDDSESDAEESGEKA